MKTHNFVEVMYGWSLDGRQGDCRLFGASLPVGGVGRADDGEGVGRHERDGLRTMHI